MAPKKTSGFMLFTLEWRNKNNRNMSVPEAVTACGDIWKNMSQQQRGPYLSKAKDTDIERRQPEKLNCLGDSLSDIDRKERDVTEDLKLMKRSIERSVLEAKKQHDLENASFIFAAFNYFTKALNSDIYIPAEFAACEFSLKSGMNSIYSTHINPGETLFGQSSHAMAYTLSTHQLPLPPNSLGEDNMDKLYVNILDYLRKYQKDSEKPLVIYTTTDLMPVVKACLRYVGNGYLDHNDQDILVYDIQYLFYVLKREVMDVGGIVNDVVNNYVTNSFFLKDFFEYQADIACNFHEENDRGKYCTQSMVTRWCYTFSDYMCGDLAIPTVPGKHMPPISKNNFIINSPSKSFGNVSRASTYYSIKTEGNSDTNSMYSRSRTSSVSTYVPRDHTAFDSNIQAQADFPDLGSKRKPMPQRQPAVDNNNYEQGLRGKACVPPERPMSAWHVPHTSRAVADEDFEFGSYKKNKPRN